MSDQLDIERTEIGSIGNYYGRLSVKREAGQCYWSIENYDGEDWREISEDLLTELLKHEEDRQKPTYLSR
jgi:hypothetical protein